MTKISYTGFAEKVADAAREPGYKVTREPSQVPHRKLWTADGLASLVRGPKYRPDILVENGKVSAIIETKPYPALIGSVTESRRYGDYFGSAVILCVPDESYDKIPQSVRDFAERAEVRLCPLSEVGDALKELLD